MNEIELSFVLPCLNEERTIETCIKACKQFLGDHAISGEVIVADNGSTDRSQEIALNSGARVVSISSKGYGAAIIGGVEAAWGRFVIIGDADGSYDFSAVLPMLEKLREGADLVMGNRFQGKIMPGAMPWKNRLIGNPLLSLVGRILFQAPVGDFHCGLRAISRDAFNRLKLRTSGMEFASEMIIKAVRHKLRIAEVPIVLYPDGREGGPHLRPFRDGWRHLRMMLLMSPSWIFLFPGLFLMLLGGMLSAVVLPAPLHVGSVLLDVHTLLFSFVFILIGVQLVFFSLVCRSFGAMQGFLPHDRVSRLLSTRYVLETGLLIAGLLLLSGFACALWTWHSWSEAEFGALNVQTTLRWAIPAAFLTALGSQLFCSVALLGFLALECPVESTEQR